MKITQPNLTLARSRFKAFELECPAQKHKENITGICTAILLSLQVAA
jgi:hypothetical protein